MKLTIVLAPYDSGLYHVGFGQGPDALIAGGLVEALTTLILPPALKSVGIYTLYLGVLFIRPSGLFGRL